MALSLAWSVTHLARLFYVDAKQVDILLGVTDVTQVLGHLSRNMPVLYVTTTRECSMALREKLGMSRKLPCYFDPNGTDERQKRITFLPDPSFTDEHKAFLRQVFPGPLMEEINQTVANEILIKSSPSPMVSRHGCVVKNIGQEFEHPPAQEIPKKTHTKGLIKHLRNFAYLGEVKYSRLSSRGHYIESLLLNTWLEIN